MLVGFLYSHPLVRLKARPVTDILCNVTGMGFTLLAGMSLGVGYLPPVLFLARGGLFVAVVYIPTVVNDVPFDGAAGYKTSGVVFGAELLLHAMIPITVAMVPLAVLTAVSRTAAWQFRVAAPLGTVLATAGVAAVFYFWRPPHVDLDPNLVLMPMDLLIVFFMAYGIFGVARG